MNDKAMEKAIMYLRRIGLPDEQIFSNGAHLGDPSYAVQVMLEALTERDEKLEVAEARIRKLEEALRFLQTANVGGPYIQEKIMEALKEE